MAFTMAAMKIALLLIQAALEELPGRDTPVVAAAVGCALAALIISLPMVWLMKFHFAFVIPGMMVIGIAAQAALIIPYFLLPERCAGGLQGAVAGILALVVLGIALPALLSLTNWQ